MENSRQPTSQSTNIPILFDIMERGENAPVKNQLQPPPPAELTEFHLDDIEPGSEDPTLMPSETADDLTEFNMPETHDSTGESPSMNNDRSMDRDALVEKVMQALMPHMEELARETLLKIIRTYRSERQRD